jgi:hypothetical protein
MSANVIQHQRKEGYSTKFRRKTEPVKAAGAVGSPVVGRTAWDVVNRIADGLRRPTVGIPVAVGAVGGIVLLLLSGYLRVAYSDGKVDIGIGKPAPRPSVKTAGLEKLIAAGRSLGKPYVLDDVTALVRIHDVAKGGKKERHVKWRIVYTVRALQPITKTDKLFKESYSSAFAQLRRWFGTEKEIGETGEAYSVMMDIPEGETRTIVTGATFVYDLPLNNNRSAFGERILLAQDQEFFSYPNQEDCIGELTLLIEADKAKISPVGQAAKRSRPDGSVAPDVEVHSDPSGEQHSISAHWKDLMPMEEVGIHFKVG